VLVLRHALEAKKTTNTARIAALALPKARIVEYGAPGRAFSVESLAAPGTWLLFPGPPDRPAGRPDRLVVVDGSWTQARRMLQRIPALRRLPRWSLAAPDRPRRRLRVAPAPDALSTLEAIAGALRELEGDDVGDALERLYDLMVEQILLARGWPAAAAP
jgi:DTW domain-containing protein YfiP